MSAVEDVQEIEMEIFDLTQELNNINVFTDEDAESKQTELRGQIAELQQDRKEKRSILSQQTEGLSKSRMREVGMTLTQLLKNTEGALSNARGQDRKEQLQDAVEALKKVVRAIELVTS